MSDDAFTTISDLVGIPRASYSLPHPKKRNLIHFGEFFENMAGIMMLPIYEENLFKGDYYKTLSRDDIDPDYVVFSSKDKKDLEIIIEVKSGNNSDSRDKRQAERYFSKDVYVLYVLYNNKCSSIIDKNASQKSIITSVGFAPLLTDTTMHSLFTNKIDYMNYFNSFDITQKSSLSAQSELASKTRILFGELKQTKNLKLNKIKDKFEGVLYSLENKYLKNKHFIIN